MIYTFYIMLFQPLCHFNYRLRLMSRFFIRIFRICRESFYPLFHVEGLVITYFVEFDLRSRLLTTVCLSFRFFGQEPPLLNIFLKKLGYEVSHRVLILSMPQVLLHL